MEKIIPEAFIGGGHEYLMSVYKDPRLPISLRLEAAAKALPYEKPRLSPIEHRPVPPAGSPTTVIHRLDQASIDKIRKLIE